MMKEQRKEVRSVLLIDDDPDDFELVAEAMREVNPAIAVHYTNSCEEVVERMREPFDLVLLDINMPHHDGFFCLRSIRKYGRQYQPVVMYTNSLSPAHIARAYEEGADLYFSKPETFSLLVKGLSDLIGMNWANPRDITKQFLAKGEYKVFSA